MKLKSLTSGFGIGTLVFAVAAIIALPVRTIQYFNILEGDTGFYTVYDWSVYLLFAVLAAAIIGFAVLGFINRKKLNYSLETKKRPGFGILSAAAAIGLIIDAVVCLTVTKSGPDLGLSTAIYETTQTTSYILLAQAVCAAVSALYFVTVSVGSLTGKSNATDFKLLSLAPVLWCIFRLVYRIARTISYIRVSDLFFEMIMIVFMLVFFMAFAQVNAGINSENQDWKIGVYGLSAALLALVCFIPRFIVTLGGHADLIYIYSGAEYCDLGIALFILSAVITRLSEKKNESAEETEEENETEDAVKAESDKE